MNREEEIAWHFVNNLTARVGTQLAVSGLFLAVTSFLIGGLLAFFAGTQPSKINLENFLADDWIKAFWAAVLAALVLLGTALLRLLQSTRHFRAALRDINLGVTDVVGNYRLQIGPLVDSLEIAYLDASDRLLKGQSEVQISGVFLSGGIGFSVVAFVIWAYMTIRAM